MRLCFLSFLLFFCLNTYSQNGLYINDITAPESVGNVIFTVTLIGNVSESFTVDYATSNGTAEAGSDYSTRSGTLVFAGSDGETSTFIIPIIDDDVIEPTETFAVTLSNLSTTLIQIVDGEGMGTIIDDDFGPTTGLYIDDVSATEDDGIMTFTVSLVGDVSESFTVDYATDDNTAFQPGDYTATSGTLNFTGTDGEIHTFDVPIINDIEVEPNEYLYGLLIGETSSLIDIIDGSGDGEIISFDDPPFVAVSINDVTATETSGMMVFTVTLFGDAQGGFTVDYNTFDITAIEGYDYTSSNGILAFSGTDGETKTIMVPILDDIIIEPTESFSVILSNLSSPLVQIADGDGIGTIIDDDAGSEGFFSITKEADTEFVSMVGEIINYEVTISNIGFGAVSNLIVVDPLVSNLMYENGDINGNTTLDLDEIWYYSATYTVTQSDLDSFGIDENGETDSDGDIDNVVTVTGTLPDGAIEVDAAHEDVVIIFDPPVDGYYSVTKVGDPATVNNVGELITYTITVNNTGYVMVSNLVVSDQLVSNLFLISGDINANSVLDTTETWIYTATYTVTQNDIDGNGIDENGVIDGDGDIDNIVMVNGKNPADDLTETDFAHEDIEIETIGVDEVSDLLFNIYPNPAVEILSIELKEDLASVSIEISDLQGQIVYSKSVQNQKTLKIDLSTYSSGTYIIKVSSESKLQIQKIIVK